MNDNFYNQFHCSYLTFWSCIWNLSDISQSVPQHLFIFQLDLVSTHVITTLSKLQMLVVKIFLFWSYFLKEANYWFKSGTSKSINLKQFSLGVSLCRFVMEVECLFRKTYNLDLQM